jgi:hypothetical protein
LRHPLGKNLATTGRCAQLLRATIFLLARRRVALIQCWLPLNPGDSVDNQWALLGDDYLKPNRGNVQRLFGRKKKKYGRKVICRKPVIRRPGK